VRFGHVPYNPMLILEISFRIGEFDKLPDCFKMAGGEEILFDLEALSALQMTVRSKIGQLVPPIIAKKLWKYFPQKGYTTMFVNSSYGIFGQYADDLIIDALLGSRKEGFYVDVGANDPDQLNNTRRFYERGWRGINIEPNPINFSKLNSRRPSDVNLNLGVGSHDGSMDFYLLEPDTLSSFDHASAKRSMKEGAKLIETRRIETRTLSTILAEYAPSTHIDFMSIDVEGLEIEVIKGNDWNRFRPELVVLEFDKETEEKVKLMKENGYIPVFGNGCNGFFVDARLPSEGR
jgi:FkbM family methyltransferase